MGDQAQEKRSLLVSCAALRDEVARIIQASRDARRLFKKRQVAGPELPVFEPGSSTAATDEVVPDPVDAP